MNYSQQQQDQQPNISRTTEPTGNIGNMTNNVRQSERQNYSHNSSDNRRNAIIDKYYAISATSEQKSMNLNELMSRIYKENGWNINTEQFEKDKDFLAEYIKNQNPN